MCNAQIFLDSFLKESGNGSGTEKAMHPKDIAPSHLPTFLLPCPHCGERMAITAVAPVQSGGKAGDLDDVTHGCRQCGTTLTRTVRSLTGDAHALAQRF
jgi:hypothetical protein